MIGKRIRDLRLSRGLTQQELGEVIGGNKQQVHRIEHGSLPTIDTVKQLAAFFEVSTDYLMGLTDEPNGHLETTPLSADEQRFLAAIRGKSFHKVLEMLAALMGEDAVNGGAA